MPQDDVTLLLIRPNGTKPARPVRDQLKAGGVFAGAVLNSLRPGGPPAPWPELSLVKAGRWLRGKRDAGSD